MRDSLASRFIREPTNEVEIELMRRRAWQDQGVAFLNPKEINDAFERQTVINIANQRYGKRSERNGNNPR